MEARNNAADKSAEFEKAVDISIDVLRVLLTEDSVVSFVEGELELEDGALMKAYKTLLNGVRKRRPP